MCIRDRPYEETPTETAAEEPLETAAYDPVGESTATEAVAEARPEPLPVSAPIAEAPGSHEINAALDQVALLRERASEVLERSQAQAQKLIDSAERRAAATVTSGDKEASRIIEVARDQAGTLVSSAEQRAEALLEDIKSEVSRIENDARSSASQALERARQDLSLIHI